MNKYQVILADPPYYYNNRKPSNDTKFGGGAMKHYNLMKDDELLKMANFIHNIANDNCILFLWITPPRLDFAMNLITEWGFTYKTKAFTWIKTTSSGYRYNPGYYTSSNSEDLLICTKGNKSGFAKPDKMMINQIIAEPIREHSQKPLIVKQNIELMYPNYKKIELFSRDLPFNDNWTVWGNEIGKYHDNTATLLSRRC